MQGFSIKKIRSESYEAKEDYYGDTTGAIVATDTVQLEGLRAMAGMWSRSTGWYLKALPGKYERKAGPKYFRKQSSYLGASSGKLLESMILLRSDPIF